MKLYERELSGPGSHLDTGTRRKAQKSSNVSRHLQWNIAAERLFFHVIARDCICPCPASSANREVFTGAALAFVGLEVTQLFKELAVLPYILERLGLYVSCCLWEIAAWLDVSLVIYEGYELA